VTRRFLSGNLNYSSWSIRPLLAIRRAGLPVAEEVIPLDFPESMARLKAASPTGKVPLLSWDGQDIWESLAITEFVAEQAAPGIIWPQNAARRSVARAAAAEMHAGFAALRQACPMDIRARHPAPEMTAALAADIARIEALWTGLRQSHGQNKEEAGPFLFGAWSAADAFYTPVVTRFRTYGLELSGAAADYAQAVLDDPLFRALEAEAIAEPWWIRYGPEGRSSGTLQPGTP
jgi:glutathione S-transferase